MTLFFPAYRHARLLNAPRARPCACGIRVVATTSSVEPLECARFLLRCYLSSPRTGGGRFVRRNGCRACTVQAWNPFHLRITADAVSLQPWMDQSVVAHGGKRRTDRQVLMYADRRLVVRQGTTNSLLHMYVGRVGRYVRCLKYWKKYKTHLDNIQSIPSWTVLHDLTAQVPRWCTHIHSALDK